MYRGENGASQTPTSEGISDLAFWNVTYTVWFCFLNWSLPKFIANFFPKFYNGLDEKKRAELPSYAAGMFHHLVVAPAAFYMIYTDYITPKDKYSNMDYSKEFYGLHLVTYAFGYIMADTLFFTIPEIMKGQWQYAIHHIAALGLYWGLLSTEGAILRYVPHFMICESSNAIFNTSWFVRSGGGRDSQFNQLLEKLFAIFFFVFRIINLPVTVHAMLQLKNTNKMGSMVYVLIPILGLQFMWLYMIIKSLSKKSKERSATHGDSPRQGNSEKRRSSQSSSRRKVPQDDNGSPTSHSPAGDARAPRNNSKSPRSRSRGTTAEEDSIPKSQRSSSRRKGSKK